MFPRARGCRQQTREQQKEKNLCRAILINLVHHRNNVILSAFVSLNGLSDDVRLAFRELNARAEMEITRSVF